MRWLIPLSAVQTLLLVMLGLHALKLDMRTDDIAQTVQTLSAQERKAAPGPETIEWPEPATAADAAFTADDIRMIIREEFEAIAAESGGAMTVRRAAQAPAQQPAAYDKTQVLMTQSAIDQDLDRYRKRGAISEIEMDQLHAKIAELPPEARRAALVSLTKAMNSGEIRGQF
ncbi:hypothetical protein [Hyphococcus sp.]|uniref:hypothetical protein n=1 Tax=Hyphococcus sp. TaxID=2038636 RepID=UPI003D1311F7